MRRERSSTAAGCSDSCARLLVCSCVRSAAQSPAASTRITSTRAHVLIVGTGIDIVEVPRVGETIARFGERFLKRIFTDAEIHYCDSKANRVERYAARFAAKEAAL